MYTINDARREMKELFEEGYGWNAVRIFLNDLKRGNDITKEEHEQLMRELIEKEGVWLSFGIPDNNKGD